MNRAFAVVLTILIASVSLSGCITTGTSDSASNPIPAAVGIPDVGSSGKTIVVTAPEIESITVAPQGASVPLGKDVKFSAVAAYSDGTSRDVSSEVTWTSSNELAAVMSKGEGEKGLAKSNAMGASTITAIDPISGTSGTAKLTVTDVELESIVISPSASSVPIGKTQQFTALGYYSNKSTKDLTSVVSWKSSDQLIASLVSSESGKGLVRGLSLGVVTVTAEILEKNKSASVQMKITEKELVSLSATPYHASIPLGLKQKFAITGTYSDGTTKDLTDSVQWSSSNASVATIGNEPPDKGVAASKSMGTTVITAVDPVSKLTVNPSLNVTAVELTSIAVSPSDAAIPLGKEQQFQATGTFSDGSTQDISSSVAWSSSDDRVAVISNVSGANGLARSISVNKTTITAKFPGNGISASTSLTVKNPELVSIAVVPKVARIPLGKNQQFTASGTYTDNSTRDLTGKVVWASSDEQVVAFNPNKKGFAKGLGLGAVFVTATDPVSGIVGATSATEEKRPEKQPEKQPEDGKK